MEPILYIISSYESYSMYLMNNSKELLFVTQYIFKSHAHHSEELQNLRLSNTMQLIECTQNNGINSLGIEMKGPLGISPLNMELLKGNGIDIIYIKNKNPIPHNGCRPKKKELKKIRPL